ncbi:hypothetical protein MPF19_18805 [Polaribacter sp. Z014]|uniref:hypothetical protein n=1 Tax=Polaribacter sp. Z014 TaxID=2927126 RepID=UPI00202087C9|nr:hypothetical protein [Polaribacter sp. Z014]MCL7765473.1 hypothetical protein [Polaribacter sp. Z014]
MSNQLFVIILAGLITIISATTELTKKSQKNTILKPLTLSGIIVIVLSIIIIALNIISYCNAEKEKQVLKSDEVSAKITIRTNTKEEMNKIYQLLPEYINARDIKIGTDNLQIDFEKESIYSGKGKSIESWFLVFKSKFVELDKFRLESSTVQELNDNNLNGKISIFNELACDNKNVTVELEMSIRNKTFIDKLKCNEYIKIKLKGIK